MSSRSKEIAKFFSGIVAHETVGHWWLGIWGRDLMPIKFAGITFTEQFNWVCMAVWPFALAALVYYGWFMKPAGQNAQPVSCATPRSA